MSIPNRVRYFAKQAYQLRLMTGKGDGRFAEFYVSVDVDDVRVESGDKVWRVPIAKAWLNL